MTSDRRPSSQSICNRTELELENEMAARFFPAPAFAHAFAARTNTPIIIIQTEGSCASSQRYHDIHGMPQGVINELRENGIAFATFDTEAESNAAFDSLVANFPECGQTTLSITAILGLPRTANREFQQIHGGERTFKIAA